MSALDDLSPVARDFLERSCAASGVAVQITDTASIAQLAVLLGAPVDRPDTRDDRAAS